MLLMMLLLVGIVEGVGGWNPAQPTAQVGQAVGPRQVLVIAVTIQGGPTHEIQRAGSSSGHPHSSSACPTARAGLVQSTTITAIISAASTKRTATSKIGRKGRQAGGRL